MTATDARPLRADAARNRQALIDAAERLFATRGLSVTLDDIAVEAGVNVATAYRHFANKLELVEAFIRQQFALAIGIAETASQDPDPWHGLTEFFERTLELMVGSKGLHDIFMPGYADKWLDELDEEMDPVVRKLIKRGQKAKVVRADLEPSDLGVLLQMLAPLSEIPNADASALVSRYLQIILDGIRPGGAKLPGASPDPADLRAVTKARPAELATSAKPARKRAAPRS